MIATTTCAFSGMMTFNGTAPTNANQTWNYSAITCQTNDGLATSTLPEYINGFTKGDIITGVLIIFIFLLLNYKFLYEWLTKKNDN